MRSFDVMRTFSAVTLGLALLSAVAGLVWIGGQTVHAGGGYEAGVALSGQTASIPPKVIECGKGITCAFGLYRVSLSCLTTTVGKGKVSVSFTWSTMGNVQTINSGSCDLAVAGSSAALSSPLYLDGVSNPAYQAAVGSGGPGSAMWRANIVLERLQ